MNWKKVLEWIDKKTSLSFWLIVILLVVGFAYRHQLILKVREETKGIVNIISGGVRTTPEEIVKAVENNEKLTVLKDEKGKSYVVSSGKSLPTADEKNPLKVIGITDFQNVGEGIVWEVAEVNGFSIDIPVTTIGAGIGISKSITENSFVGGGVIFDYEIDSIKTISNHSKGAIWGGWRF
jgi:hypothetical protein